jgi:hypothetical protein
MSHTKAEYADESSSGILRIIVNMQGDGGSTHSWDHMNHLGGK